MKEFNTAAICIPSKHYMVNIADKVAEIRQLVDAGRYFTINRARQFGKTTTLTALAHDLAPRYIVISISFEGIGDAGFQNEATFVKECCRLLRRNFQKERRVSEKRGIKSTDYSPGQKKKPDLVIFLTLWHGQ